MKFSSALFAFLTLSVVHALPMETCEQQRECFGIVATPDTSKDCGVTPGVPKCGYKVCLKLDLNDSENAQCVKSSADTISHTCVADDTQCNPVPSSANKVESARRFLRELTLAANPVQDEGEQCQYVEPGGTAYFVLKDGVGCNAGGAGAFTDAGGNLSCKPKTSTDPTCSNGPGQNGKECVWTFTAPSTCSSPITCPPGASCAPPEEPSDDSTEEPEVKGDPHFKTWSGEKYDFHGICDLVLLTNREFSNNRGMDIHIRSKKTRQWSYISNVALRIGDDVFEVAGRNQGYWINKIQGEVVSSGETLSQAISGFPIRYERTSEKSETYTVQLGDVEAIEVRTWNAMVGVKMIGATADNFQNSLGLLGSYGKGIKLGRDSTTVYDDNDVFGQQWQVQPLELTLFHEIDGPQAPQFCEIPSAVELRRRLAETTISIEDAQAACERVNPDDLELCVFDVMATNDKESSGAY